MGTIIFPWVFVACHCSAVLLGLVCLWGARGHLESAFCDYSVLKSHSIIVLMFLEFTFLFFFWLCVFVLSPHNLWCLICLPAVWLLSPSRFPRAFLPLLMPIPAGWEMAANQMCQRFEAEITVVRCLLVPSPEAVFLLWKPHKTQNWKGPTDH